MEKLQLLDQFGQLITCHICGKPATGVYNVTANCASSVPSVMKPACNEHLPYTFLILTPARPTATTERDQ